MGQNVCQSLLMCQSQCQYDERLEFRCVFVKSQQAKTVFIIFTHGNYRVPSQFKVQYVVHIVCQWLSHIRIRRYESLQSYSQNEWEGKEKLATSVIIQARQKQSNSHLGISQKQSKTETVRNSQTSVIQSFLSLVRTTQATWLLSDSRIYSSTRSWDYCTDLTLCCLCRVIEHV